MDSLVHLNLLGMIMHEMFFFFFQLKVPMSFHYYTYSMLLFLVPLLGVVVFTVKCNIFVLYLMIIALINIGRVLGF